MATPIIQVEHLCFSHQDQKNLVTLEDINLSIHSGEYVGIIGPNGGGKTTLLKLILGFLKPASGKISIFGLPPKAARERMAYVPQALAIDQLFPISVQEIILSGCLKSQSWISRYTQDDYKRTEEVAENLKIADLLHRPYSKLSGGQARRVLIARSIISRPELLLLDEPTAGVDPEAEAEIYEILNLLKKQMTILMVTHNLKAVVDNVEKVICVERHATVLKPEQICEHFAFGLYHPPLIKESDPS